MKWTPDLGQLSKLWAPRRGGDARANYKCKYKPEFKAKVAIEALKGDKSTAELAQIYGVHPAQISNWKKQLADNATSVFEAKGAKSDEDSVDVDALYKKIGQLQVEMDPLASRPGILSHLKRDGR